MTPWSSVNNVEFDAGPHLSVLAHTSLDFLELLKVKDIVVSYRNDSDVSGQYGLTEVLRSNIPSGCITGLTLERPGFDGGSLARIP